MACVLTSLSSHHNSNHASSQDITAARTSISSVALFSYKTSRLPSDSTCPIFLPLPLPLRLPSGLRLDLPLPPLRQRLLLWKTLLLRRTLRSFLLVRLLLAVIIRVSLISLPIPRFFFVSQAPSQPLHSWVRYRPRPFPSASRQKILRRALSGGLLHYF